MVGHGRYKHNTEKRIGTQTLLDHGRLPSARPLMGICPRGHRNGESDDRKYIFREEVPFVPVDQDGVVISLIPSPASLQALEPSTLQGTAHRFTGGVGSTLRGDSGVDIGVAAVSGWQHVSIWHREARLFDGVLIPNHLLCVIALTRARRMLPRVYVLQGFPRPSVECLQHDFSHVTVRPIEYSDEA